MATVTPFPVAVQDIMETDATRLFWEVVRHHERPPFHDPAEGMTARLNKAARVVYEQRITPQADGAFVVEGAPGHTYRVREHCSCPDGTYRKERPCYHAIAVTLYVEWQRRLGFTPQGLPLGPASVEERLAQPVAQPWMTADPPPRPQEDPMTEDPDPYIPAPHHDAAAVAVLEPLDDPRPGQAPATVVTRSRDVQALVESMAAWKEQRQVVTQYIKEQMQEGIDYYTLRIKGRDTKPTLSKAGSEKFLHVMQLVAHFEHDAATWQMLGSKEGLLCYTCVLTTREGTVVGEGRGARTLAQDGGDINKAVKMAQKSAQIDAILRTGCLSDCFTQDLDEEQGEPRHPARTTSADLRQQIWAHIKAQAPDVTGREAAGRWVQARTGYALVESNFPAILVALEETP